MPLMILYQYEGAVELRVIGGLTVNDIALFRLYLIKVLQFGKSKSFKLNLKQVMVLDTPCLDLIRTFSQHLKAVNASLTIDMPEDLLPNLSSTKINPYDEFNSHPIVARNAKQAYYP